MPGTDTVFVAPELVLHYVRKHRYQPPPAFQKAVLDCPAMESPEYFAALQAAGLDVVEFSMPPRTTRPNPECGPPMTEEQRAEWADELRAKYGVKL